MPDRRGFLTNEEHKERRDWLVKRQQSGIGSSEIHRLLTGDALEVYHNHTRPITEEDVSGRGSIHLLRGRWLEPLAVELYFRITGRRGQREKRTITHPDYPGASASMDATIFQDKDGAHPTGVLEAKAPGLYGYRELAVEGTREAIIWQLQHLLAVSRRELGAFSFVTVECEDGPLIHMDVEPQPDVGRFCLEVSARFWAEHVIPRVPPKPAEWAALMAKAPALRGRPEMVKGIIPIDDEEGREARTLLIELVRVNEVRKLAELARENVQLRMTEYFESTYPGATRFEARGIGKLTRVYARHAGGFDKGLLAEHKPIDRDAFVRFLLDNVKSGADWGIEEADKMADELALDLGQFVKPGKDYDFWKSTPAKDVE